MHVDEGSDRDADRANGRGGGEGGRPERIGIGGGDDNVTRIQLAARWSEAYAPESGDTLVSMLKRFRLAFDYLDAVLHGVEPVEPEEPEPPAPAAAAAPASPGYTAAPPPSWSPPAPTPPAPPEAEPRPWP